MAKSAEKRRQKALQRKAAKRKEKKGQRSTSAFPLRSTRARLRDSGSWPLYECLLTKDWQAEGSLVQILVSRRSPQGQIAVGVFLVDLGCLGVKNAFGRLLDSMGEYRELRRNISRSQELTRADLDLAAKIIREAIAYAEGLGFKPNRDYPEARLVLGEADPDACDTRIPLGGKDGKPFYFAGPYDNAKRIVNQLMRNLGPDGFHYVVPVGGDEEVFLEDE